MLPWAISTGVPLSQHLPDLERPEPPPPSAASAGQVVLIVLTRTAFSPQPGRHRRAGEVDLGVNIERGLVGPQFQQREFVGIQHTLKYLELFAAGFLRDVGAALPEGLREFRPSPWSSIDRDD